MRTYRDFAPTSLDPRGLGLPNRQDWLVGPCGQTRDSDCLEQSNWGVLLAALEVRDPDGEDHEIHRFGHWGPGWVEIVIIRPGTPAEAEAQRCEDGLAEYPILDEMDFSEREDEAAQELWRDYTDADRVAYIRAHRTQFEFRDFEDLLGCARGTYFAGYASDLLAP